MQLRYIDGLLVRNEYKIRIYAEYFLGSLRFLFSVHDLNKTQLKSLDTLSHRYLKQWLGLPRGATWALVHDVHGLNIKSFEHLYLESRSLTLCNIRFFSDSRVQHALNVKEEREGGWRRKFSSAIFAKGLCQELVPPVASEEENLTVGNDLDLSQDSWSSLEMEGALSPPPPPVSPPPLPTSSPPLPISAPPPPASHDRDAMKRRLKKKVQSRVQDGFNDFGRRRLAGMSCRVIIWLSLWKNRAA